MRVILPLAVCATALRTLYYYEGWTKLRPVVLATKAPPCARRELNYTSYHAQRRIP
jgi:hypothetical protein